MSQVSEFEQQEQSIRLMDDHGPSLAREAADVAAQQADAQLVGLIVTPDAGEAKRLAEALSNATGQDLRGRGFVGLVPREFALTILRSNAPATLDWLEPEAVGGERRLPLVVATKDGFRLGASEYPSP